MVTSGGAVHTPTRDRLIDEAMRLFGEQGYRATSVVQIERASGLAPGSGGLYHHFRSKEHLLEAGIDRQLGRMTALRDIRQIFEGLTDMRSELTVLCRYMLSVIDDETQLLRIASDLHGQPAKLADTFAALIEATYQGMADWIQRRSPQELSDTTAQDIAAVALNALFAHRMMPQLLGVQPLAVPDERIVDEWVAMIASRITDTS